MSYRPEIKTNANGTTVDFPLDAETVKGVDVVATKVDVPLYLTGNNGSFTQQETINKLVNDRIESIFWRSSSNDTYENLKLSRHGSSVIIYVGNITRVNETGSYRNFQRALQIEIQNMIWSAVGYYGENLYDASQTDNLLSGKQDSLTAGAGITIDANNEISVTNPVDVMSQTQFDNATGGTTPDVPVDIFSIKELIVDNNLIDGDKAKFLVDEYEKTLNLFNKLDTAFGGVYVSNGTLSGDTATKHSNYIEIKPNTSYIHNIVGGWGSSTGVVFYDSSYTFISGYASNNANFNSFTTPATAKYLRLTYYISSSAPTYVTDENSVMLVEGTTLPSVYIPHYAPAHFTNAEGTLLKNEYELTENIWDEQYRLGYYSTNGVYNSSSTNICSTNYIKVNSNTTYYFSNNKLGRICYYNSSKTFISYEDYNQCFTTPSNCSYIMFDMTSNYGTTYKGDIAISLEGAIAHQKDITPVLLWQNGSPNSSYSGNITTLDMSKYKNIIVAYKTEKTSSQIIYKKVKYNVDTNETGSFYLSEVMTVSGQGGQYRMVTRALIIISSTTIDVGSGRIVNNGSTYTSDDYAIPIAVYGSYI